MTLLLLRHAKSSWGQPGLSDFDRPLNQRGAHAAPLVGNYIAHHKLVPDLIYCSAAKRTTETAKLVATAMTANPEIRYDRAIYEGSAETIFQMIAAAPEGTSPVMVIGHNPAIHTLAIGLCENGNEATFEKLRSKYPTAALTVLDFEISSWHDIRSRCGTLRDFVLPRELAD